MKKTPWLILVGAMFAAAACSTKPQEDQTTSSTAMSTESDTQVSQVMTKDTTTPSVVPGSLEDFTLNIPDRVFFGFDRFDLNADAVEVLNAQVEWLRQFPNVTVVIGGHADNRGTREYNLALSERRAQAVRDYMVGLGVSADRIGVVPYGKERPAVIGDNEEAWAANRRAVTNIDAN